MVSPRIAAEPTFTGPIPRPPRPLGTPGGGWLRRALWGLGAIGGGAAMLTLGGSATLAHIVTRPRHLRAIPRRAADATVEEVAFRTADGLVLRGWLVAPAAPRDVIVVCHGFAMSGRELLDLALTLRGRDHAVLLFDFRGHGLSEGARTTIGYRESGDIVAAIDFLGTRRELVGLPLGVAGISMGAAATLLAAAREPRIAAVSADSSFAALAESAGGSLRELCPRAARPLGPLVLRFAELLSQARLAVNRPVDAIAAIGPRPVLLIHDSTDSFIPVRNAHTLRAAARGPVELWIRPGRGHASLWACCADEYAERLDAFFRRTLGATIAGAA